jgi:hypothetical protein
MPTHATEAAAREQLRRISRDLEALRFRLLGVQASLPASPLEHDPLREDDAMDPATEIRTAIGCVLADRIDPALRDLQAAAAPRLPEQGSS